MPGCTAQRTCWPMRRGATSSLCAATIAGCWPRWGGNGRASVNSRPPSPSFARSRAATGRGCLPVIRPRTCPPPTTTWSTASAQSAITSAAPRGGGGRHPRWSCAARSGWSPPSPAPDHRWTRPRCVRPISRHGARCARSWKTVTRRAVPSAAFGAIPSLPPLAGGNPPQAEFAALVFLSVARTVSGLIASTTCNSTKRLPSKRRLQRA